MTIKLAFLGGGAIGSTAALIAATKLPSSEITVIDRGINEAFSRQKTFVLLAGSCGNLEDLGLWKYYKDSAHSIQAVNSNFEGSFGSLSLHAKDCLTDAIGFSIAENDMIQCVRSALLDKANVKLIDNASVNSFTKDGLGNWTVDGKTFEEQFSFIVAAGLLEPLLNKAGYEFTNKSYGHRVIVSTYKADNPTHIAKERFIVGGACTLVPRRDGYGHILIVKEKQAAKLLELSDEDYAAMLVERKYAAPTDAKFISRVSFKPSQRIVKDAGIGKTCLLGASAYTVHPVGAQELNLGLRDSFALANMLGEVTSIKDSFAENFAQTRLKDRNHIAKLTDLLAHFVVSEAPGKLCLAGIAATMIDVLPPARRFTLAKMIFR